MPAASLPSKPTASVVTGRSRRVLNAGPDGLRKDGGDEQVNQEEDSRHGPDPADIKGQGAGFHRAFGEPFADPACVVEARNVNGGLLDRGREISRRGRD